MHRSFRLVLTVVLLVAAAFSGWQFKLSYDRISTARQAGTDTDLVNVRLPDGQRKKSASAQGPFGVWGGMMVVTLIGAGLLGAYEVSLYFGQKTLQVIYNDDGEGPTPPEYDQAEEVWAKGDYLGAIQMLREYLQLHPREQHVALRIAEIYEKDLQNPLAAALEYEEVLKQNLPRERWGWAAIHLCNLYSGKLNQQDKAIALLRRVDQEYEETQAAGKARARLSQLEADGIIPPVEEPTAPPADTTGSGPSLPPGFAPKKP